MKNKSGEVIGILSVTILFYSFISFFSEKLNVPDLLSDIKVNVSDFNALDTSLLAGAIIDSNYVDSTNGVEFIADSSVLSFGDLTSFFQSLEESKRSNSNLHIAYFGDSMIEGDLLTMDLRSKLQQRFGGAGVGFMPITSQVAGFRSTIQHSFNSSWVSYHFNEKPPKNISLGIAGYSFKGSQSAQVRFAKNKSETNYRKAVLFYSSPSESKILIKTDSLALKIDLPSSDSTAIYSLIDSSSFSKLSLEITEGEPILYGISLEKGAGIYIDNFSFRGNSGIPLSQIPSDHLKSVNRALNYKLIVLHFGLNVVGHNVGDYSWYIKPFRKTIQHFKKAFPDATLILASVCDKSYNSNGRWNTEPDIPKFVNIQAQLAAEENICFWNLYKAMGGFNSMKKWVEEENPRLANKDYTHFNHQGAKKAAELFYNWMMEEYDKYLKNKNALSIK